VTFKLNENGKPDLKYDDLVSHFSEKGVKNPTLKQVRQTVIAIRNNKLENPRKVPNTGSFFKNPIITNSKLEKLIDKYPDMPHFPHESNKEKLSAGWLINKAGWKGKTYKQVAVSNKHALIIINPGGRGTAGQISELSGRIIDDIFGKFGIKLEREVEFIS
jgi:UDP-N-acetylmuramate dehydrogenase